MNDGWKEWWMNRTSGHFSGAEDQKSRPTDRTGTKLCKTGRTHNFKMMTSKYFLLLL